MTSNDPLLKPTAPELLFDRERAANYDQFTGRIPGLRDTMLHFLGAVMADLPADSRILCVGVGTGNELIFLAKLYPDWTFVGIDPSEPMMNICRTKVAEAGLADRCELHTGYLDSLALDRGFDAATCLLVSHFLMETSERQELFANIAKHLKPGGMLVSADLATAIDTPAYRALTAPWFRLLLPPEATQKDFENARSAHGTAVALLDPVEVESLIQSAGFTQPVRLYQCLLIHGWVSYQLAPAD
ncbi:class I SAM-dependent methyltransferase [Luteolibacter pohnpeiensis]|uniref:Class I SAM-dependent methyltransferase n=1 Tax=Luteolibacter pohnpeiensis TaxID=454153 RepID=A0A934VUZ0_9BACT|nr:class I SAM-dependent methyltransferase [Luteolibacter pohnpeiensis]MBK1881258.1 class I SAM-dependent methyltransferase [Luteolibacter pohnpeiensis]